MKLSAHDIQNALLQLFGERRLEAGDEVRLSRLETFWERTRLRRADLLQGIVSVTANGLVTIEDRDGDPYLALTANGAALAQALASDGSSSWHQHLQQVLLPAVRVHMRAPEQGARSRRHDPGSDRMPQIVWPRH